MPPFCPKADLLRAVLEQESLRPALWTNSIFVQGNWANVYSPDRVRVELEKLVAGCAGLVRPRSVLRVLVQLALDANLARVPVSGADRYMINSSEMDASVERPHAEQACCNVGQRQSYPSAWWRQERAANVLWTRVHQLSKIRGRFAWTRCGRNLPVSQL
jgi:hypothetical protein